MPISSTDAAQLIAQQQAQAANAQAYAGYLTQTGMFGAATAQPGLTPVGSVQDPRAPSVFGMPFQQTPGLGYFAGNQMAASNLAGGVMQAGAAVPGMAAGAAMVGSMFLPGLRFADPFFWMGRGFAGGAGMAGQGFMGAMGQMGSTLLAGNVPQAGRMLMGGLAGAAVPAGLFMGASAAGSWGMNQALLGGEQFGATQQMLLNMRPQMPSMGQAGPMDALSVTNMFRGMTSRGGESFPELMNVAAIGGQMGMFRNTQNIQQFQRQFTDVMETARTLARVFQTTVEQGAQAMGEFQGMGVFQPQQISRAALRTGGLAAAGGISTQTMMGLGQVGAQMLVRMGGGGQAGAQALQTLGARIGMATRTGLISQEEVFNATGLPGEEGIAALSQRFMGMAARQLRGPMGRVTTAALMDPATGQADPALVRAYESGALSMKEMRELARENLRTQDARLMFANRGEEIRGDIMGQMDPMRAVMGRVRNVMDVAGMRQASPQARMEFLAQRFADVSAPELKLIERLSREGPETIERAMRDAMRERALESYMSENVSLDALKRRLYEHTVGRVARPLQQFGANLRASMTRSVNEWINEQLGVEDRFVTPGGMQRLWEGGITAPTSGFQATEPPGFSGRWMMGTPTGADVGTGVAAAAGAGFVGTMGAGYALQGVGRGLMAGGAALGAGGGLGRAVAGGALGLAGAGARATGRLATYATAGLARGAARGLLGAVTGARALGVAGRAALGLPGLAAMGAVELAVAGIPEGMREGQMGAGTKLFAQQPEEIQRAVADLVRTGQMSGALAGQLGVQTGRAGYFGTGMGQIGVQAMSITERGAEEVMRSRYLASIGGTFGGMGTGEQSELLRVAAVHREAAFQATRGLGETTPEFRANAVMKQIKMHMSPDAQGAIDAEISKHGALVLQSALQSAGALDQITNMKSLGVSLAGESQDDVLKRIRAELSSAGVDEQAATKILEGLKKNDQHYWNILLGKEGARSEEEEKLFAGATDPVRRANTAGDEYESDLWGRLGGEVTEPREGRYASLQGAYAEASVRAEQEEAYRQWTGLQQGMSNAAYEMAKIPGALRTSRAMSELSVTGGAGAYSKLLAETAKISDRRARAVATGEVAGVFGGEGVGFVQRYGGKGYSPAGLARSMLGEGVVSQLEREGFGRQLREGTADFLLEKRLEGLGVPKEMRDFLRGQLEETRGKGGKIDVTYEEAAGLVSKKVPAVADASGRKTGGRVEDSKEYQKLLGETMDKMKGFVDRVDTFMNTHGGRR